MAQPIKQDKYKVGDHVAYYPMGKTEWSKYRIGTITRINDVGQYYIVDDDQRPDPSGTHSPKYCFTKDIEGLVPYINL